MKSLFHCEFPGKWGLIEVPIMNWLADKIEQWPTAKLLPYARNARTYSEEQVAQIEVRGCDRAPVGGFHQQAGHPQGGWLCISSEC